jgi:drug/metabolite transporter (DMT)-like permease
VFAIVPRSDRDGIRHARRSGRKRRRPNLLPRVNLVPVPLRRERHKRLHAIRRPLSDNTRAHHWLSTPFQPVLWEALLATAILTVLAVVFEGPPRITWTAELSLAFAYSGIVSTALGYWAMTVVNSQVTATTTSLGILATPVFGIAASTLFLGERLDSDLIAAAAIILLGIAIGTTNLRQAR